MKHIVGAALAASLSIPLIAFAQGWNVPPESQRCPSKWGAGDERGSGNHMKNPQNVLRGARLIKTGEVIELGHVLGPQMAFFGTRIFNMHLKRTFMNTGRNTGWGKLYGKDNARFVKSTPGVGVAAAEWLAKQDPMLVGSDNWPVEVSPNPDKDLSLPVHQIFLVVNGIHILENLKLDELAAKRVHEFAFTMQPLKIQGGNGSTVAPAAIR